MHDHNDKNGKQNSSMMWMMLICAIPLVALLFFGGWSLRGGPWFFPVAIGVFVLAHIWMMFKGHGSHSDEGSEEARKGQKKHDGCCH